jgi:hypothetical protein
LSQHPQQLDFFDQVFDVLMYVGEATDGVARQMGGGRGQIPVFRLGGQGLGHGGRAHMGRRGRMARDIRDGFAFIVYFGLQLSQAFDVFSPVF